MKILFLQLPTPESISVHENIPYAAGCLSAYLKKHRVKDLKCIIPDHSVISKWGDKKLIDYILRVKPDYVAFTAYLWNVERSLYIASQLKKGDPSLKTIFGGPEITHDNKWIFANKFVDHFVIGEGEGQLYEIVAGRKAPKDGAYLSPYLEGTFPIKSNSHVLIEAQRGCPFSCAFCFYPKAHKKIGYMPLGDIEKILKLARMKKARDIVFIDPTFNNYKDFSALLDVLIKNNKDRFFRFHAEIKPHLLKEDEIAKINKAGFKTLEVGLQTIKKSTQQKIKCRIPLKKFSENLNQLSKKITIRLDLISALPGEILKDVEKGLVYSKKHHPRADVYLYPLSVLPGTTLRQQTDPKKYQSRPPYHMNCSFADKLERAFEKITGERFAEPKEGFDFVLRFKKVDEKALKKIRKLTSENPFGRFSIVIPGGTRDLRCSGDPRLRGDDILEIIIANARLNYDWYINRLSGEIKNLKILHV